MFVWAGRVRNAVADDTLAGAALVRPLVLSLSFLVPALVLLVGMVLERRGRRSSRAFALGLVALAGWTTVVWVVRAVDIALGGDHGVAFVAVHVGLAAVSIGLGWAAVRAGRGTPDRGPSPSGVAGATR